METSEINYSKPLMQTFDVVSKDIIANSNLENPKDGETWDWD